MKKSRNVLDSTNTTQILGKNRKQAWIKEKKILKQETVVEETDESKDNDHSLTNELSTDEIFLLKKQTSVDEKAKEA